MKNCKVKCVKCKIDDRRFIVGKTYEVDEDGHITGEGFKYMENEFNLTTHFLNDFYEFELVEDLRDKVFQTHNEITIRDGRTFYMIDGNIAVGKDLKWIGCNAYNNELKVNSYEPNCCDIMQVYNPITKKVVYDRNFVDWSKVKVDTPILVSYDKMGWCRGHFAKYEDGVIYAFGDGTTSWSTSDNEPWGWKYAKLAEGENE